MRRSDKGGRGVAFGFVGQHAAHDDTPVEDLGAPAKGADGAARHRPGPRRIRVTVTKSHHPRAVGSGSAEGVCRTTEGTPTRSGERGETDDVTSPLAMMECSVARIQFAVRRPLVNRPGAGVPQPWMSWGTVQAQPPPTMNVGWQGRYPDLLLGETSGIPVIFTSGSRKVQTV